MQWKLFASRNRIKCVNKAEKLQTKHDTLDILLVFGLQIVWTTCGVNMTTTAIHPAFIRSQHGSSVSTAVPVPRVTHLYFIFFHRKENNNIFLDDLKEDGEKRPFPNPCRTFLEAFDHYPEIMENIERVGFLKPTPIQVWAWCLSNFILYFIINYTVSYYCRI